MYRPRSFRNTVLMSAIADALASVGGTIASAAERVEEAVVMGALKCTHAITDQVCQFDSLDELENFLAGVADSHHWIRSDAPAQAAAAPIPEPSTGSGVQTAELAIGTSTMDATGTVPDQSATEQATTDAANAATSTEASTASADAAATEAAATATGLGETSADTSQSAEAGAAPESTEQAQAVDQKPAAADTTASTDAPATSA